MHPCELLQSLLFPSAHHSQECLLQKYSMLAGTMHPSPPFFFFFLFLWGALYSFTERLSESSQKNSLSHYTVNRSPNTAECHQSQLSHVQGENGSLQRALDLLEAFLDSTGFWETFREKPSCIARWKATRTQTMDANGRCLLRATDEAASILAWQ